MFHILWGFYNLMLTNDGRRKSINLSNHFRQQISKLSSNFKIIFVISQLYYT